MTSSERELIVLIMSVGEYTKNYTAKWLVKIGGKNNAIVCLPKCFEANAESYKKQGMRVYIYDETKYINDSFEYFGFRPRNCGGVGRQGIAEAVEKFGDDKTIILELDDDTSALSVAKMIDGKLKRKRISEWESLKAIVNAEMRFYERTGIECAGFTGATPPPEEGIVANRKIFNNFIMIKGNRLNFDGFKALCSDDYRFNMMNNLLNARPMISHKYLMICFVNKQGDRNDGNAPLYNSDFSWKKSYALKMVAPWAVSQRLKREGRRFLFRENILPSKLYPPICVADSSGNIIGEIKG